MKFTLSVFAIFLLTYALNTSAIVNMEEMRVGPPKAGFSGHLDLSINGETGNTEKQQAGLGSRLQWQHGNTTDFIVLSYDYAESGNVRDTNKSFAHGRHVVQYRPRRAWEAFAQIEENEFARLSFRGLLGAGLRFTLAEKDERLGFYLGTGAFWSRETLDEKPGLTDHGSENFGRANLYLVYKHKLNSQLRLVSTTYYQPRLDNGGDYRALEQAGLAVKLTDDLNLKLTLDIAHDSRPPQSIDKTDTSYHTSLSYEF
jgi:putative salt-induced outer membrane protein YdiY